MFVNLLFLHIILNLTESSIFIRIFHNIDNNTHNNNDKKKYRMEE